MGRDLRRWLRLGVWAALSLGALAACGKEATSPNDGDAESAAEHERELEFDGEREPRPIEWLTAPEALTEAQKSAACEAVAHAPDAGWDCGPCPSSFGCYDEQFYVRYENVSCAACAKGTVCVPIILAKCHAWAENCVGETSRKSAACEVEDGDYGCEQEGPSCDVESLTVKGLTCSNNDVMFFNRGAGLLSPGSDSFFCFWGECESQPLIRCPEESPCTDDGLGFFASCGGLGADGDR